MTATTTTGDWASEVFPGDGTELPSDAERDRADALIDTWNQLWREQVPPIPRVHPTVSAEGFANYLAGTPTNRAYMRAQLRRWWRKP